jgi:hypothetical protein
MTSVYVIGGLSGPKKIGIAQNPRQRLHAIRSSSLMDVQILHAREAGSEAWKIEGHAHRLLKNLRIRGEWFDVPLGDAIAAIDAAALCAARGEPVGRSVGRKKEWTEQLRLPLAEGTTARIDSVLSEGEPRLDLIREAIEREIKRRQRVKTTD